MVTISLLVQPGPPDVPQTIDFSYSGLDPVRTLELLTNGAVRVTRPVHASGAEDFTFNVPPGQARNNLADIRSYSATMQELLSDLIVRVETGLGDSVELRYQ